MAVFVERRQTRLHCDRVRAAGGEVCRRAWGHHGRHHDRFDRPRDDDAGVWWSESESRPARRVVTVEGL